MARTRPPRVLVHKVVLEIRYDHGFTYLDRCGYTLNELLRSLPGWELDSASPQASTVRCNDLGAAFSFNSQKLDLNLQQTEKVSELLPIGETADLCSKLADAVLDSLGIEDITRVGFRVWQVAGEHSKESAAAKIKALGIVSLDGFGELGLTSVDEASFAILGQREEVQLRVAVASVEQQIQIDAATLRQAAIDPWKMPVDQRKARIAKLKAKRVIEHFPQYSVLVDIDSFVEYPRDFIGDSIGEYVSDCYEWSEQFAKSLLS